MGARDDIDVLARTIYGEARGEYCRPDGGLSAFIAVGNVIMNRFKKQGKYGKTISEVCLRKFQFSCWNASDPNCYLIRHVNESDDLFRLCLEVATGLILKDWPDITKGADHYHASWMDPYPGWSMGRKSSCRIGQHLFYKLS